MLDRALLVAAAAALAGCGSAAYDSKAATSSVPSVRVIVADLDTSINPYHEYLYAGSAIYKDHAPSSVTPDVLEELGVTPERQVELTRTGKFVKDREADAAFWKSVRRNKPYWFKGTNVIALSVCPENWLKPDAIDANKDPHGVGTSSAVLTANPDAVLLFVEVCADIGADAAHDIGFLHPAVDIITTSYGVSIPNTGYPLPEATAFRDTFEGVVKLGKLHFSSGGNGSGSSPHRAGAGPWWSIGVSGIEEGTSSGDQTGVSGNFSDFVSDFTQTLPYCLDGERCYEDAPGTSFSTPRAAGVASRVLLEARRALGHTGGIVVDNGVPVMAMGEGKRITNWDLRRALEEGAYAGYTAADYDPVAAAGDPWPTSTPVVDAAPWLTIGWGDLTADPAKEVVVNSLAALGLATATRTKDAGFCDFQTAVMDERIAYWNNLALDSGDHTLDGPVPYVFCGSSIPPPPGAPAPDSPVDGSGVPALPSCTDVMPALPSDPSQPTAGACGA
ncbi:MAG TPA: S8 family serine peptidase [Candidatus Binatia bacterium]|nr:S8 family serine peptidase [Candidatus Binatia bacterium]